MEICKDCIKQDVCKFKKQVEKYESEELPEPLQPAVSCKYKEVSPYTWTYSPTITAGTTRSLPDTTYWTGRVTAYTTLGEP